MKIYRILFTLALALILQGAFAQTEAVKAYQSVKETLEKEAPKGLTRGEVIDKMDKLNQIDIQDLSKEERAELNVLKLYLKDYLDKRRSPQKMGEVDFEEIDRSKKKFVPKFKEEKDAKEERAEKGTTKEEYRNQIQAEKEAKSAYYELMDNEAAQFPCIKLEDTVMVYDWTGEAWVNDEMKILTYNDDGYVTSEVVQEYNETDFTESQWVNSYKEEYTYDSDNNVTKYEAFNWSMDEEGWIIADKWESTYSNGNQTQYTTYYVAADTTYVPDERWTYTYDNDLMTSKLKQSYNTTYEVWWFNYRYTYEWNADAQKIAETGYTPNEDTTGYVADEYWAFDVKGWDYDETEYSAYGGALWKERWAKWSYDAANDEFGGGYKWTENHLEIDEYYYHVDVVGLEYGDLEADHTEWYWNSENQAWEGDFKEANYEYNKFGEYTHYVVQKPEGDSWADSLRITATWLDLYDDCGNYDGSNAKTMKEELWDGSQWLMYYDYKAYDANFGDPDYEMDKVYDFANGEFVSGTYTNYQWNSSIVPADYAPYAVTTKVWDADDAEWVPYHHYEFNNQPKYRGSGNISAIWDYYVIYDALYAYIYFDLGFPWESFFKNRNYSYFVNKSYDTTNNVWNITTKDTTIYNDNGNPETQMRIGYYSPGDTTMKSEMTYSGGNIGNAKMYSYTGGEFKLDAEEQFTYSGGNLTEYVELDHDYINDTTYNVMRTDYSYTAPDNNFVDTTFEYTTIDYEYVVDENGDYNWVATERIYWGDDWDIHADWDTVGTNEYVYTEWWFDQEYQDVLGTLSGFQNNVRFAYGRKDWDPTGEYFWYDMYKLEHIAYSSGFQGGGYFTDEYEDAYGSPNGRHLIKEDRYVYDMNYPSYTYDEYEWDGSSNEWFKTYYYVQEGADDVNCNDSIYNQEGYKWSESLGDYIRWDGYEEGEEYDDYDRLAEDWYKSWSNGNVSGSKEIYEYDDNIAYQGDTYYATITYQTVNEVGNWENNKKEVFKYTGSRPPQIIDDEITDVACYGDSTGMVDITVGGGTMPYSYSWSNQDTTEDLMNVPAGVYTGTVTDANGCSVTSPLIKIEQPQDPITIMVGTEAATDKYTPDGKAWVDSVYGGTPPYAYKWNNPLKETTDTASGLRGDEYTVTVTDALGCVNTKVAEVEPIVVVGMDDLLEDNVVTVYPNPATRVVNVAVKDQFVGSELTVYSTSGSILHKETLTNTGSRVDISDYDPGMYIITVESQDKVYNQKLLVK